MGDWTILRRGQGPIRAIVSIIIIIIIISSSITIIYLYAGYLQLQGLYPKQIMSLGQACSLLHGMGKFDKVLPACGQQEMHCPEGRINSNGCTYM